MTADRPISLWDTTAAEPDTGAPLDGDATCDLAIVGGGYTGLSTALHGAERGLHCHVIEAHGIGHGGSGRNVGLVNAGLWLPPQDVHQRVGKSRAPALIERLGEMPGKVFDLIERHGIACEPMRNGTIHAAHAPAGLRDLERRAQEWQRLGAPVELLDAAETERLAGTGRFHGGLLDRRAGTVNPMGYARGLARAASGAGARISTDTPVTKLTRTGDRWHLVTPRGTISAKQVVLATNAYTDKLWPGLRKTFVPIHFFQMATEPLGERGAAILPGGQGLWDTSPVMHGLRRDAFGRLIVGSMGSVIGGRDGLSRRWAQRTLARLFPDLGAVRIEEAWHGRIAMTPNHLFRIHRLDQGLWTAIGYNGRGITTGTMLGAALADLLTGGDQADLPVRVTGTRPVYNRNLKAGFYHTAFAASQALRSL